MPSFVTPANGDDALAEHVAQVTEDLSGLRNIPISITGINDAAAYAQTIKNAGTGSKGLIIYAADGTTVLLQVDGTGVKASRTGGAAEAVLTTASSFLGAWTAFTPTVTQSVAITLTSITARYIQIGKLVIVQADVTANSAGSGGNFIVLGSLPVSSALHLPVGYGQFYDLSATTHYVLLAEEWGSATSVGFVSNGGTLGFGGNPVVTIAAGDILRATLVYEAA